MVELSWRTPILTVGKVAGSSETAMDLARAPSAHRWQRRGSRRRIGLLHAPDGFGELGEMRLERKPGEIHLAEAFAGFLRHDIQQRGGNFRET